MKRLMGFLLIIALFLAGCGGPEPLAPASSGNPAGKPADEAFIESQTHLAIALLQQAVKADAGKNLLISPLSVAAALSMTANGAAGAAREEMLELLGGHAAEDLNNYYYSYLQGLGKELSLANSVWIRDAERLTVEEAFLQIVTDYYGAEIYREPFDHSTVEAINGWVDRNTDGMIQKMVEEISEDTVLYLINALAFDGEWENTYERSDVVTGLFANADGVTRQAEMLNSEEHCYLETELFTGFLKDYKGGNFRFGALLPKEDGAEALIQKLTAEALLEAVENAENTSVGVRMPKFSYEYEISLNEPLQALGMKTAFDSALADLSPMATSRAGNLYVSKVLHKTFIEVSEKGTRAGAATSVEVNEESAEVFMKEVILDRPFVYFILDAETNLPVFLGILAELS
ncbi:MAG: serpin family protein [Clostridia bacterium]|nr:serpin family protein [Clostridia bacterium]